MHFGLRNQQYSMPLRAPPATASKAWLGKPFRVVFPFCAMAVAPRCHSPPPQSVTSYVRRKPLAGTFRDLGSRQEKARHVGADAKAGSGKQEPTQDAHYASHLAGHSCRGCG